MSLPHHPQERNIPPILGSPFMRSNATIANKTAEEIVGISSAVAVACSELAEGRDYLSHINEDTRIGSIRAAKTMFFKALHEGSNCYLVLNKQTLELLYLAMEGGLQFITQEKAFNVEMQKQVASESLKLRNSQYRISRLECDNAGATSHIKSLWNDIRELKIKRKGLEMQLIELENAHQLLILENIRLKSNSRSTVGEDFENIQELDNKKEQRQKRRRRSKSSEMVRDTDGSDLEDGHRKKLRKEPVTMQ